jgi:hypothetical protein
MILIKIEFIFFFVIPLFVVGLVGFMVLSDTFTMFYKKIVLNLFHECVYSYSIYLSHFIVVFHLCIIAVCLLSFVSSHIVF